MSDPTGPSTPMPEPAPAPSRPSAPTVAPWSALAADLRLVAGAGIAAAVAILVGGVIGAWPAGEFLALALLAAVALAGAAWAAATRDAIAGFPLRVVATLAGSALAAIAVLAVVESLFDLDDLGDHGGILGLAIRIAVAVLAGLAALTAARGDGATLSALRSSATPARLAVLGLAFVLAGWAVNLASYWTTRQAAPLVVVLVLAALLVALGGRGLPALATWIGAGLAVIGALLAAGLWGQLMRLGEDVELGALDFIPFLVIVIGLLAILAAAAQAAMASRVPTGPSAPSAPPLDSGAS